MLFVLTNSERECKADGFNGSLLTGVDGGFTISKSMESPLQEEHLKEAMDAVEGVDLMDEVAWHLC